MASEGKTLSIPILPLATDFVLLPGVTFRIPVSNRPDIPVLLTSLFKRTAASKSSQKPITVGCVPVASPFLSKDGHHLIEGDDGDHEQDHEHAEVRPEEASKDDLFAFGTLAKITGVQGRSSAEPHLIVEGMQRFTIEKFTKEKPFQAEVLLHDEIVPSPRDSEIASLFGQVKQLARELVTLLRLSSLFPSASTSLSPNIARRFEVYIAKKDLAQAASLADFMGDVVQSTFEDKLQILASFDLRERLERVVDLLTKQVHGLKNNVKITSITSTNLPSNMTVDINQLDPRQREAIARRSLGGANGANTPGFSSRRGSDADAEEKEPNEIDELQQKLEEAQLSPEAQKVANRELKRLRRMNPVNAEYGVCRNYLENLAEIPWTKVTEDQLGSDTLQRARKQLDDDHYGLERIKKRLLEYLAVLKLKQSMNSEVEAEISKLSDEISASKDENLSEEINTSKEDENAEPSPGYGDGAAETKLQILKSKRMTDKSPILLLVGPPGTGKTSLAKSVATSLGRKFHRISLGGVRDEAEIRGHRRTYVAAMPGLIVNGLKKLGVSNPVFLLDEIDKVGGSNFHGDPSAAMLEVLDPEQNHSFSDHYINIPIDLSKVLFIATANTLDTIPPPLLDRMETINLTGYTTVEKRHIAKQHLVPKQVRTNGLSDGEVQFTDDTIDRIITAYTRESGVRNLEREIGSVCRYKAVQYADSKDASKLEEYNPLVNAEDLEEILGNERFDEEIAEKHSRPGVVTGLVAYSTGGQGSILFIEVADMPGNGRVQLTGTLGDVLKESVEVALTWVKAHSYDLGLTPDPTEDIMKHRSLHVHCPSGAVPKDGPSAGLAHTIALISLFAGKAVPPQIAMTGEVSLRGRVMPVGGIKEKLIGALRAGVKTVLLPEHNSKDIKDVPLEVKQGLDIIFVTHIWEAIKHIWPHAHWPGEHQVNMVESRL